MKRYPFLKTVAGILVAVVFFAGAGVRRAAAASFDNPDFAYPSEVSATASSELGKALGSAKYGRALAALLECAVADARRYSDSADRSAALIDSAARLMPQPYRGVAQLLEASVYASQYNSDRRVYSGRALPLTDIPASCLEWSREIYLMRITALCDSAWDGITGAGSTPLSALGDAVTFSDVPSSAKRKQTPVPGSKEFTVEDFAALRILDLLEDFDCRPGREEAAYDIPFFGNSGYDTSSPEANGRKLASDVLEAWERLAAAHPGTVPSIMAVKKLAEMQTAEMGAQTLLDRYNEIKSYPASLFLLRPFNNACERMTAEEPVAAAKRPLPEWASVKSRCTLFREALKRHPGSEAAGDVENMILSMTEPHLYGSLPALAMPGQEVKAIVNVRNVNAAKFIVVKVPVAEDDQVSAADIRSKGKVARTFEVRNSLEAPFSVTDTVSIGGFDPGYYVVLPSVDGAVAAALKGEGADRIYTPMNVTGITGLSVNTGRKERDLFFVVRLHNQQPVEGATVEAFKRDYRLNSRNGLVRLGTFKSATDGTLTLPDGTSYVRITYGDEKWQGNVYSGWTRSEEKGQIVGNVFADRAIARPGDQVRFSAVIWRAENRENTLQEAYPFEALLLDASYQPVDTLSLVTDKWGRAQGEFTIPEGRLLGQWQIAARDKDAPAYRNLGQTRVRVEEYRLPTFSVTIDKDKEESGEGTIVLKGKAMTFSGMPVANAEVRVEVTTRHPYWRPWGAYAADGRCYTGMRTGADGTFHIVLSSDSLRGTQYENGYFHLSAAVTDNAGETREAPGYDFSFAKGYSIAPEIPGRVEMTGNEVRLNVPVYDSAGLPAIRKAMCRVTPDWPGGGEGFETEFDSPVLTLPAKDLVPGRYKLTLSLADDEEGNQSIVSTVIYRADDAVAPRGVTLWTPATRIVAKPEEEEVTVSVGSDREDNWILCVISDLSGESAFKWVKTGESLEQFDVPAPASNGSVWVNMCAMQDKAVSRASIEVIPEERAQKTEIETESFRPAISAGEKETWKFRFTRGGLPAEAAVMAVMSDAALNSLQPFSWSFSGNTFDYSSRVNLSPAIYPGATISFYKSFPGVRYKKYVDLLTPDFRTWGYGLTAATARPLYMSKASANGVAVRGWPTAEEVAVESVTTDSAVVLAGSVRDEAKMESAADAYDSVSEAEAGVAESAPETPATAYGGPDDAVSDIPLRPSELPVAFFMPDLVTDREGVVELKFEVPDYNTTWQLQLLGYTPGVQSATKTLETVASKKVMARLNAPRFVRTLDRAVLAATLYNNSDSELAIGGRIDIVDADGKVIASKKYKGEKLDPAASRVITLDFDVPSDLMQIAVRAYATGGGHSDGEETIIPVMPSSEPVIESTPFWLAPGTTSYTVKLPKFAPGSMVTLSYCDNPAWTCLTALPALAETESDNALTLSRNIFANATAAGLLVKYPRLKRGLEDMLGSDRGNGDLVSPLERNEAMKTTALAATPWLPDAQGETARMRSLGSLTDSIEARRVIEAAADRLAALVNADGSWSWCKGMQGSEWITQQVVRNLAPASGTFAFDIPSVAEMARKGMEYVDSRKAQTYLKAKREGAKRPFDLTEMNRWMYDRRGIAGNARPSGAFGELCSQALTALAAEWRDMGISDRAEAAINLWYAGKRDTAAEILKSFASTALTAPDKGMWFDTLSDDYSGSGSLTATARVLEAFALISPDAPEVDQLRQWLVMQKQVQDWGKSAYAIPVIRGILTSGSDWTQNPAELAKPVIKLGGKELKVPSDALLSGAWSISLTPREASGSMLSVSRSSEGPAWGGVMSARIVPVREVKASAIPPLSVSKELYLIGEDGRAIPANSVKVGDKVRVTITVKCDRAMDYVALTDSRAACLEPVEGLSGYSVNDGIGCYREVRTSVSNMFFDRLPKGTHVFSYDCRVMEAGEFAAGIATVQSQYSPLMTATSAGLLLTVRD